MTQVDISDTIASDMKRTFNPNAKTIEDLEKMTKFDLSIFADSHYEGSSIRAGSKREAVRSIALKKNIALTEPYIKEWWQLWMTY